VNQVMGDGIMAVFGASIAHEDHAVRAGLLRGASDLGQRADRVGSSPGALWFRCRAVDVAPINRALG
jgi:class 3 adenylate cyclase